ncbi:MAG: hypothetical protein ACYCXK_07485 [Candidatus Humimicrobiaceae bacterium]
MCIKRTNRIYDIRTHGGDLDSEIINTGITQKDIIDASYKYPGLKILADVY